MKIKIKFDVEENSAEGLDKLAKECSLTAKGAGMYTGAIQVLQIVAASLRKKAREMK